MNPEKQAKFKEYNFVPDSMEFYSLLETVVREDLRCRLKCHGDMATVNGELREGYFPEHFHYLQFCYYKCKCVCVCLLFVYVCCLCVFICVHVLCMCAYVCCVCEYVYAYFVCGCLYVFVVCMCVYLFVRVCVCLCLCVWELTLIFLGCEFKVAMGAHSVVVFAREFKVPMGTYSDSTICNVSELRSGVADQGSRSGCDLSHDGAV